MASDELLRDAEVQHIAAEGARIYETIKTRYGSEYRGKFLAIEIKSENVYLGNTSSDAMALARVAHPNTVFYVVKIGFDAAETMAQLFVHPR